MVEPVVNLLNGRGYRVRRTREAGLADEDDQVLVEYCLNWDLVLITFDSDLRDKAVRGQCRVVHIRTPERTARERVAAAFDEVIGQLSRGSRLVTVRRDGSVDRALPSRPLAGQG